MIFTVEWDYPALAGFNHIPWPTSGDVAAAVYGFAAERAPVVPSGLRWIHVAGYGMAVRVDRRRGTVLVLAVYQDSEDVLY